MKIDSKALEAAMAVPFKELPDDLREPLHSLQADLDWLFGRVAADGSVASAMKESVRNRLSQIETASYRLANEAVKPQPAAPEVVAAWKPGDTVRLSVDVGYASPSASYSIAAPPPAPQGDVAEAVAKEREAILDEMDRMWRQFIAQCESLEDETLPPISDDPLKLAAHHFMRGQHSAAKRIRRSVDHPKYNSDCPVAQAAIRARAEQKADRA